MAKKNILLRSKKKKAQALLDDNRLEEARALLEQLAEMDRRDAETRLMLGVIAGRQGDHQQAAEHLGVACALQPGQAPLHYNLGIALRESGDLEAAIEEFARAAAIRPDYAEAQECLAHALIQVGDLAEAVAVFRQALRHRPDNAEWHSNLGSVLQAQGHLEDAVVSYREALRLKPALATAYDSLGSALTSQGKFDEALACYRESLRRFPANHRARSNLLLTLNYLADADPAEVFEEHKRWGTMHGVSDRANPPAGHSPDPERRLRVGYVSPDFRAHSVAFFIEPLLSGHGRQVVEVVCYSDVPRHDAVTTRLRATADLWRDIHGLKDDVVADRVRADGIDILVDLAGHTAHNRLAMFARRPAPVQVTYLGYPGTTGLAAMDYRLTDAVADPDGEDHGYTEQLVRLPPPFLCYQPLTDAPAVSPLPVSRSGHITFGSFNNLAKIGPDVIALWAELTVATPGARLLVKNPSLTDDATRERYYAAFAAAGLARDRVELVGHTPTQAEHLALYSRLDIALDTFPYNGTTTTCEALWMGVPVVTLAGRHHAGRVGASLLTAVGHPEWIAATAKEYVATAAGLAADLDRLRAVRAALRPAVMASALCDAAGFSRRIESAYRDIWRRWCESRPF